MPIRIILSLKSKLLERKEFAGKKGTVEQLLTNKSIMKEARSMRRNLVTVWLDYRKAFDSIPHDWLLEALRLAKIPQHLITAVKNLTEFWYTILNLNGTSKTIVSDLIKILTDIYQGDSLSVILFVRALNPLSHLLRSQNGYAYGRDCKQQHAHNFFVDDLKLYGTNMSIISKKRKTSKMHK